MAKHQEVQTFQIQTVHQEVSVAIITPTVRQEAIGVPIVTLTEEVARKDHLPAATVEAIEALQRKAAIIVDRAAAEVIAEAVATVVADEAVAVATVEAADHAAVVVAVDEDKPHSLLLEQTLYKILLNTNKTSNV